uniref:Ornithine decarboxylase antizyme 3 n=1 Tax=Terrapene triunguis TaxID=2587831 RepID=A0A674IRD6_9SAUR
EKDWGGPFVPREEGDGPRGTGGAAIINVCPVNKKWFQILQVGNSVGSQPVSAPGNGGFAASLQAGNLTVFAGDLLLPGLPVQLDFHFQLGPHSTAHWHGLLTDGKLFLDTPRGALDQNNRESLTATLEYVEEQTAVNLVFVNFQPARSDRGALLRAFSYLGFEVVRPDHPSLPPWQDVIFMVYPLERDCCPELE